jgi:cytochrome c-type biogenesis protein CcmE
MGKIQIVAIVMIIIASAILVNGAMKGSKYATFQDALKTTKVVKITGELAKDKPIEYDAENNFNETIFFMRDANNEINKVILSKPKPMDFERAEQVVVDGIMKDNVFYASEILTKCPSKYKDEELKTKAI